MKHVEMKTEPISRYHRSSNSGGGSIYFPGNARSFTAISQRAAGRSERGEEWGETRRGVFADGGKKGRRGDGISQSSRTHPVPAAAVSTGLSIVYIYIYS